MKITFDDRGLLVKELRTKTKYKYKLALEMTPTPIYICKRAFVIYVRGGSGILSATVLDLFIRTQKQIHV